MSKHLRTPITRFAPAVVLLAAPAVVLLAALAVLPAAAGAPSADIVDTAVEAGSFNTLVAAVQAAGLVDALKGDGPLTVFAPTDEAFAKLPAGTVDSLLQPENKEKLQAILKYHVVAGKLPAEKVTSSTGAATLQGESLRFAVEGGTVKVSDAKVLKADVECSNGVIHVIDTVLIPE